MNQRLLWSAIAVAAGLSSCASSCGRAADEVPLGGDVLATVDGVPIRVADIEYQRTPGLVTGDYRTAAVEGVVREQVVYARAMALGLDADPGYKAKLARLQAQFDTERRRALGEVFVRKEIADKVKIDEDAARRFFDEHHEDLRTEVHLQQILRRSQADIEVAQKMLREGAPMEVVAGGPGSEPFARSNYDLFWKKPQDLPEEFRAAVATLKPGEVSGVVRRGLDRYYLLKLVDKRQMPDITFDSQRMQIFELLKRSEVDRRKKELDAELRAKARVKYAPTTAETPPNATTNAPPSPLPAPPAPPR